MRGISFGSQTKRSRLSDFDESYDLLDVLRVVKNVWVFIVFIPMLVALALGSWGYISSHEESPHSRSRATIRIPAGAFQAGAAERILNETPELIAIDGESHTLSIIDIPSAFQPVYRTLQLTLVAAPGMDSRALLKEAIEWLQSAFLETRVQNEQEIGKLKGYRRVLAEYFDLFESNAFPESVDARTVSEASAALSLIDAIQELDGRIENLEELRQSSLELLEPATLVRSEPSLRWIRFPIFGAVGALIVVLFVAFTIDRLQIAAARRQREQ